MPSLHLPFYSTGRKRTIQDWCVRRLPLLDQIHRAGKQNLHNIIYPIQLYQSESLPNLSLFVAFIGGVHFFNHIQIPCLNCFQHNVNAPDVSRKKSLNVRSNRIIDQFRLVYKNNTFIARVWQVWKIHLFMNCTKLNGSIRIHEQFQ